MKLAGSPLTVADRLGKIADIADAFEVRMSLRSSVANNASTMFTASAPSEGGSYVLPNNITPECI